MTTGETGVKPLEHDPYPGLNSFEDTEQSSKLFFGRTQDAKALLNLVLSEQTTVLFSRSGLGKSSLLNAGLLGPLRQVGYFPIYARITHDGAAGPVMSLIDNIHATIERSGVANRSTRAPNRSSLWEYFDSMDLRARNGDVEQMKPLTPVLILDQFEELFTHLRRKNPKHATLLVEQLADVVRSRVPDAVRARAQKELEGIKEEDPRRVALVALAYENPPPKVKVVLAIREDYLPELQSLRLAIPAIFRSAMRIEPLTPNDARDAIILPGKAKSLVGGSFEYDDDAVDAMLAFLLRPAAIDKIAEQDGVEPIQLQLLCQHVNTRRLKKKTQRNRVTLQDLGGERAMRRATAKFYGDALGRIPLVRLGWNARRYMPSGANWLVLNFPRWAMRSLCERGLIVSGKYRNSLNIETARSKYGVVDRDLEVIEKHRLVSQNPHLDNVFYELTHDSLVEPIRRAQRRRPFELVFRLVLVVVFLFGATALIGKREAQQAVEVARAEVTAEQARKRAQVQEQVAAVNAEAPGSADRAKAVRTLIEKQQAHGLSLTLPGVDLSKLDLQHMSFEGSDLQAATLTGATLVRTRLSRARLEGATLDDAVMWNADLSQASLKNASLRRADLRHAKLSYADLKSADLTDAELDGADFLHANVDQVRLEGTAWWLANWDEELIWKFKTKFPLASYSMSAKYKREIEGLTATLEAAKKAGDQSELAHAYNGRAWKRATHGESLDDALADVAQALETAPSDVDFLDTKAYILLQKGRNVEAVALMREAAAPANYSDSLGERLYHYALALERMNDPAYGGVFKRAEREGHVPTYELVLTPRSLGRARTLDEMLADARSLLKKPETVSQALAEYRAVLEIAPDNATAASYAAYAMIRLDDVENARTMAERALVLANAAGDAAAGCVAKVVKARLAERKQNWDGAKTLYHEALALQPTSPWARQGLQALDLYLDPSERLMAAVSRVLDGEPLETSDIEGMTAAELRFTRNAVFTRNGVDTHDDGINRFYYHSRSQLRFGRALAIRPGASRSDFSLVDRANVRLVVAAESSATSDDAAGDYGDDTDRPLW